MKTKAKVEDDGVVISTKSGSVEIKAVQIAMALNKQGFAPMEMRISPRKRNGFRKVTMWIMEG